MKITINIRNRQPGKSRTVLYEYFKDTNGTFIIIKKLEFQKNYYLSNKVFCTPFNLDKIRGKHIDKIIIDDYFNFSLKERELVYNFLNSSNKIKEIIIFSTPNEKYSPVLLDLIRQCKQQNIDPNKVEFISNCYDKEMINNYYFNLITSPSSKIIDNIQLYNKDIFKSVKKESVGQKKYELEILGKYI